MTQAPAPTLIPMAESTILRVDDDMPHLPRASLFHTIWYGVHMASLNPWLFVASLAALRHAEVQRIVLVASSVAFMGLTHG